jgi:diacylglycerol kinase family enzyme
MPRARPIRAVTKDPDRAENGGSAPRESWSPRPSSIPPASERIAVVINGNAKRVTEEVIDTLDEILDAGDLFVSRRIEEGRYIARTIVERGYGTVLMGGGDGTFTVMVSDVVRQARRAGKDPPRFGLLRLGTGNALAWVIGASAVKRGGLKVDIERLRADAGSRPIRLVEVEGYLAPFCGFGIDAVVLRDHSRVKKTLARGPLGRFVPGALTYAISCATRTLPGYVLRAIPSVRVVNEGAEAYRLGEHGDVVGAPIGTGEVIFEGSARFASVSTIPYYGFGFRCFPFADERPDRMNLRISTISPLALVANFPAIWRGDYDDRKVVSDFLVEEVSIETVPETEFQIGGDPKGKRKKVRMRLAPDPIRLVDFYAPPHG